MYSASKKWVNGQMVKLRDHLAITRYGELKEEHKQLKKQYDQKSELCDEKQQKIERQMRELQTQDLKLITSNSQVVASKKKLENAEQIMIKQENSLSELREKQKQDKNKFNEDLEAINQEKAKLEKKRIKDKEKIKVLKEELAKAEELRLQSERNAEDHKEHSEPKLELDDTTVIIDGLEQKIKEITELCLCLNQEKHIELINQLIPYKMPPLKSLTSVLAKSHQNTELLNKFFSNSICEHIQHFSFGTDRCTLSITPCMSSLSKVLPCVTQQVSIYFFDLAQTEFEELLVAAKNAKWVRISRGRIVGDCQLDFGGRLEGAAFEEFEFRCLAYDSEGVDEIFFRSIVKGLAEMESEKSRMIRMVVDYSHYNKEKGKKILKEYGLTKIKLG
ncbi:unnamed protein product [Moneuplotes crassus]|uniref:Uncharacterized protein n=1 Tax=Euplotes crassus TaxID=5936 RepID=A0AAD1U0X0_EUPCR|nr:unnamed protein product [Moneuplotes crassus]